MNQDILFIRELKIETFIGILSWEKHVKQQIILDLEFSYDVTKAAKTDKIEDALDYVPMALSLTEYVSSKRYNLIEALAEDAVNFLATHFHIKYLRLTLTKPSAIANAKAAGVSIQREF